MTENHEILTTLEISSPELERLVTAARNAGAWGAKLSGAGWGGNMIALSPPEPAAVEAIAQALTAAGAAGVIVSRVS
jgi:mevalonate kinase